MPQIGPAVQPGLEEGAIGDLVGDHADQAEIPGRDQGSLNERIAGYEQDSTHLAEHPKPAEGIAPMVLGGVIYTERENAGKAIVKPART